MSTTHQAISDAIRAALLGNTQLSAVKVFFRGPAVIKAQQDLYPLCEIILAQETGDNDLTGGTYQRTYGGVINYSTLANQASAADWADVTAREANTDSYDDVAALVTDTLIELQRETWRDLNALTNTQTATVLNYGTLLDVTGESLLLTGSGGYYGYLANQDITPSTVSIKVSPYIYQDDGAGNLADVSDGGGAGTIDYTTGAVYLPVNAAFVAAYTYDSGATVTDESLMLYELLDSTLGGTEIAPTTIHIYTSGGTLVYTDNLGDGVLIHVSNELLNGTVDYTTGVLELFDSSAVVADYQYSLSTATDEITVTDVVTDFYIDGPVTYGIDERDNNYENFATIPFTVLVERTIV